MKYYLLYKTTNLINRKYYIGCHITDDLNDGYLGSGKYLKRAIVKYGKENFKCDTLKYCSSEEEMFVEESKFITEETIKDPYCYNLRLGGKGGWTQAERIKAAAITNSKYDFKTRSKWHKNNNGSHKRILSEEQRLKWGQAFKGKKHSINTKLKIGTANSINQLGSKNSQFGTFWITNGIENKKSKGEIPEGWRKGRV